MRVTRTLRATVGAALTGALFLGTGGWAVADESGNDQWPLTAFDAAGMHEQATGKGVTVAVIDSGFFTDQQDLTGKFLKGHYFPNAVGKFVAAEPGEDIRTHGTSMAALIAGGGHGPGGRQGLRGLAPDAKILPLTADKETPDAIRYAVDHGADVISMSFGADKNTPDLCESLHYAVEQGVVTVAGVGNDGLSEKNLPAGCPGVIGVGAVDEYGKVWDDSNYNSSVDLLAPGVDIPVLGGDGSRYGKSSGTSISTAYVSAAAALLKEKFPDLTPGQIANRLVKTAGLAESVKKDGLKLPDAHYGYGYIQPGPALRRDIPAGPAAGPLPMPEGKASKTPVVAGADKGQDPDPPMGGKKAVLLYGGIGLGVVIVLGVIIGGVALVRRRSNAGSQSWG
ncbi:S8 family serine peptidase [Streptomyces benahoarensis]|uniref:S8 family serine peptidase n=1 Tax=Streptomyces benahoarensis TaxID=2595054 RepID=A0A553ZCL0_9ACTN|nr:S8 family serine peptidase [Streptomyces benahoarensis]TSB23198.1 S8 family serine peptidase [Streptomyces benahoarensis]TSB39183.1 S8 family serine peptidase [Streptomyces benahoarensis]